MPKSVAKSKADARFDTKTYEQIAIKSRREDRLRDLIAVAASRYGVSSGEYIRSAIWARLQADGIERSTLDDLPPHGRRLNAADAVAALDEDV